MSIGPESLIPGLSSIGIDATNKQAKQNVDDANDTILKSLLGGSDFEAPVSNEAAQSSTNYTTATQTKSAQSMWKGVLGAINSNKLSSLEGDEDPDASAYQMNEQTINELMNTNSGQHAAMQSNSMVAQASALEKAMEPIASQKDPTAKIQKELNKAMGG